MESIDKMRYDARTIIESAIHAVLPDSAVLKALEGRHFVGKVIVVAIGKAAWQMAYTAQQTLGNLIFSGVVITKYGHSKGPIKGFEVIEAGHPVVDANAVVGTKRVLELVSTLRKGDHVIFLASGGGSALFEMPMPGVRLEDIAEVTDALLRSGANIVEINTIRKRLSAVKGGRFAEMCGEAEILSIVLSDVLGDRLDSIASGPAYPDKTTSESALSIIDKYGINISSVLRRVIQQETPKQIKNVETLVVGSVSALCRAAALEAERLGYVPTIISTMTDGEAKNVGQFMSAVAWSIVRGETTFQSPCAIIIGGETVVKVNGNGKGGRNQELALSAALAIEGLPNTVIFSVGSDGTDGPTEQRVEWSMVKRCTECVRRGWIQRIAFR